MSPTDLRQIRAAAVFASPSAASGGVTFGL
ncbi:hypothetical protein SAMN05444581_11410 [Methylocapsa palsarum]|uniref:Uncharacterized protein n=1 Tax=Methylocapsa palsarum TaxID=1612308 RepID=A0A1I4BCQ5_9HYPH|nr:hypothetical protein SAMN05444581_11410 [Methylocapsa palsarum]